MTGSVFGKVKNKKHHHCCLSQTCIGFNKGVTFLDVSKTSCQKKYASASTNGFIVTMPIVTHFKAEAGITSTSILNYPGTRNQNGLVSSSSLSFPLTIQYYFLPKACRLQPYIGVGSLLYSDPKRNLTMLQNNEAFTSYPGTKYISILFTQGITFEINTKIHLTESIHFLSSEGRNTFGVSFGIGFYLP